MTLLSTTTIDIESKYPPALKRIRLKASTSRSAYWAGGTFARPQAEICEWHLTLSLRGTRQKRRAPHSCHEHGRREQSIASSTLHTRKLRADWGGGCCRGSSASSPERLA